MSQQETRYGPPPYSLPSEAEILAKAIEYSKQHIPYTTHVWWPSRDFTYCGIHKDQAKASQTEDILGDEEWLREGSTETGNICVRCARAIVQEHMINPNSYEERARQIGALTDEKNAAYGSSFDKSGAIMAVLYPDGIQPEQFGDALVVVRIVDKLFRIANRKNAFGENPWADIAGYGVLMCGKPEP